MGKTSSKKSAFTEQIKIDPSLERKSKKAHRAKQPDGSRLQIAFFEKRRCEEIGNIDIQSLADLVDHSELDRIVGAVDDIADRGFRYAAAYIKLILRHVPFRQKFLEPYADCLVQLQLAHRPFL